MTDHFTRDRGATSATVAPLYLICTQSFHTLTSPVLRPPKPRIRIQSNNANSNFLFGAQIGRALALCRPVFASQASFFHFIMRANIKTNPFIITYSLPRTLPLLLHIDHPDLPIDPFCLRRSRTSRRQLTVVGSHPHAESFTRPSITSRLTFSCLLHLLDARCCPPFLLDSGSLLRTDRSRALGAFYLDICARSRVRPQSKPHSPSTY